MTVTKMNPEVKAQWIEALESGEYQQYQGALTKVAEDGSESHCCLGVLTELAVKAGVTQRAGRNALSHVTYVDGESSESAVLPEAVVEWAGLSRSTVGFSGNPRIFFNGNETGLAALNDGDGFFGIMPHTFCEIAKIIADQL